MFFSEEFSRVREEAPIELFTVGFQKTQRVGHNLDSTFTLQSGGIAGLDPDLSEKTGNVLLFISSSFTYMHEHIVSKK